MELPIEIWGTIILLSERILLLKSINKTLRNNYQREILKYELTTPISKREIDKYVSMNKHDFWLFTHTNYEYIDAREFIHFRRDGRMFMTPNTSMIYDINLRSNVNTSRIEYNKVVNRDGINCDINTIYNIIKNRSSNCSKYVKSLCLNTILTFSENMGNEFEIIYLYLNLKSFGLFMISDYKDGYITADNLLFGKKNHTKKVLKDMLIKQINSLDRHSDKTDQITDLL